MRTSKVAVTLLFSLLSVSAACAQGGPPPLTGLDAKLPGAEAWYAIHADARCVGTAQLTAKSEAGGVRMNYQVAYTSGPKSPRAFSGVWRTGPGLTWLSYAVEEREPAGLRKYTWTASVSGTGFFVVDQPKKQRAFVDLPADAIPRECLLLLIPHLPWAEGTRYEVRLPDGTGTMARARLSWEGPAKIRHRGAEVDVLQVALTQPDGVVIATYAMAEERVLTCTLVAEGVRIVGGSRAEVEADLAAGAHPPAAPARPPAEGAGPRGAEGRAQPQEGKPVDPGEPGEENEPMDDLPPVWTVDLSVDSGLQEREGTIYFVGEAAYPAPGRVFALDAATGRTLWEGRPGATRILGFVNRHLIVLGETGSVHRLDAASGKESGRAISLFTPSEARSRPGPEAVALCPDGSLVRTTPNSVNLIRADGTQVWSVPSESMASVRAAVDLILIREETNETSLSPDGRSLTATGSNHRIRALEAGTGKVAWKIESAHSHRDGTTRGSVEFRAAAECSGRILYIVSSQVGLGYRITLHALDPESGREQWSAPIPYDASHSWQPVADGTSVYIGGQTARGFTLQAVDLANGKARWTQERNYRPGCVHTEGGNALLFALDVERKRDSTLKTSLAALDIATGSRLWRIALNSQYATLCAGGGRVFVGEPRRQGAEGRLRAFRATPTGR